MVTHIQLPLLRISAESDSAVMVGRRRSFAVALNPDNWCAALKEKLTGVSYELGLYRRLQAAGKELASALYGQAESLLRTRAAD